MTLLVGNNAGTTTGNANVNAIYLNCSKSGSNLIGQTASFTGTVASIVVSVKATGANRLLQCAIYNSGGSTITLLGYTLEMRFVGSETGNIIVPMASQSPLVSVTSGAQYILAVWTSVGTTNINTSNNGNTTNAFDITGQTYVTYGWPATLAGSSTGSVNNDFMNMWATDNGAGAWLL